MCEQEQDAIMNVSCIVVVIGNIDPVLTWIQLKVNNTASLLSETQFKVNTIKSGYNSNRSLTSTLFVAKLSVSFGDSFVCKVTASTLASSTRSTLSDEQYEIQPGAMEINFCQSETFTATGKYILSTE